MLLGLDRVALSNGEEAMYKEKYENLVNTINCLMFGQTVDTVDFQEFVSSSLPYIGRFSLSKTLNIPNATSIVEAWCFSSMSRLETINANDLTVIGASSLRDCTALKTAYLDSLQTLGSTYSFSGNTALEDLYIRKKTAAQLLAWTALLDRIPTTCTVHGSDGNVVYNSETSAWEIES